MCTSINLIKYSKIPLLLECLVDGGWWMADGGWQMAEVLCICVFVCVSEEEEEGRGL